MNEVARIHQLGTCSGSESNGWRIAVSGRRTYRQVAILAMQNGYSVSEDSRNYPQLVKIARPNDFGYVFPGVLTTDGK